MQNFGTASNRCSINSNMPAISVIICTHNPRQDYLERTLAALKEQTLPDADWELLLIDNASKEPLEGNCELSWHPNARIVREDELGLTAARLRGIKEASADLLVFVDDDNVLDADYLSESKKISMTCPFLGAWGGQVIPEFEVPPPESVKPYLHYLLIREFKETKWSNLLNFHETSPCGAGMVIRRQVVNDYLQLLANDPRRKELGRKGQSLFAGEDSDMALCSLRVGLGTGIFPSLRLAHLIPKNRLTHTFFLKVAFGGAYSFTLLDYLYGIRKQPITAGIPRRILTHLRRLRQSSFDKKLADQQRKGVLLAQETIQRWEKGGS
jgi:hypothetical protein